MPRPCLPVPGLLLALVAICQIAGACGGASTHPRETAFAWVDGPVTCSVRVDVRATADRALAAADEALARGCPRGALAWLGVPALARSRDARVAAAGHVQLLRARQAMASIGEEDTSLLSVLYDPNVAFAGDVWRFLTRYRPQGGALAALSETGVLAAALVRGTPTMSCVPGVLFRVNGRATLDAGRRMRSELLRSLGLLLAPREAHVGAALDGLVALWGCELPLAARRFDEAAQAAGARAKPVEACRLAEHAWQARYLVGGRRSDLGYRAGSVGDDAAEAADEEAAAAGAGPLARQAKDALAGLDALVARFGACATDPIMRATIGLDRAFVLVRLAHRYEEGRLAAREAARLAHAAGRADLADQAAVVALLASVQMGDAGSAEQIGRALGSSTEARLGIGVAEQLQIVALRAKVLLLRGRAPESARVFDALARVPFRETVRALFEVAAGHAYVALDRSDEALERYARARALLRRDRALVAVLLPSLVQAVAQAEAQAKEAQQLNGAFDAQDRLGAGDELPPVGPAYAQAIRALYEGQPPEIQPLVVLGLTGLVGCLPLADEIGGALARVAPLLPHLRLRVDPPSAGLEETLAAVMDRISAATTLSDTALSVASCAARLRRPAWLRTARAMASLADFGGRQSPFSARVLAAAEAEAKGDLAGARAAYLDVGRHQQRFDLANAKGDRAQAEAASRAAFGVVRTSLLLPTPDVTATVEALEGSSALSLRRARAAPPRAGADKATTALDAASARLSEAQNALRNLTRLQERAASEETARGLDRRVQEASLRVEAARRAFDAAALDVRTQSAMRHRGLGLAPPPSLQAIQQRLRPDEVLVYYVTSADDAFAIWVQSRAAGAVALPMRGPSGAPDLPAWVVRHLQASYRTGAGARGAKAVGDETQAAPGLADAARASRAELHRRLIAPLQPYLPRGARLLIVPDAGTSQVDFAALGPPDSPLVADHPVRILPGAFALPDSPDGAARPLNHALVLADPDFDGTRLPAARSRSAAGTRWTRLPGTRVEAAAVAALYGVEPLVGAGATEDALRQRWESADVLHLATHGQADAARPAYSALVLAAPRGGREDGLLHAYEVERARLSARMVVLSACETGRGAISDGEGALALDRSFLLAGAEAVVSSLWPVADDATAELMTVLHRALRRGVAADRALAEAMNHVRAQPRWADPRFWSAFRVVGAGMRW